jgi:hypothetical protein
MASVKPHNVKNTKPSATEPAETWYFLATTPYTAVDTSKG